MGSRGAFVALVVGLLAVGALLFGLQVGDLERELVETQLALQATQRRLDESRATQARQDAAILAAEDTLERLGPPCSALVDLHPALRALHRGNR